MCYCRIATSFLACVLLAACGSESGDQQRGLAFASGTLTATLTLDEVLTESATPSYVGEIKFTARITNGTANSVWILDAEPPRREVSANSLVLHMDVENAPNGHYKPIFKPPHAVELAPNETIDRVFLVENPVTPSNWWRFHMKPGTGTFDENDPSTYPTLTTNPDAVILAPPFTVKVVIGYGDSEFLMAAGETSALRAFFNWQKRLDTNTITLQ